MSDDTIRRSDAIKAFTLNSKGERIPFVDCDNFPVEFPLRYIVDTLSALPSAERPQGEWINKHEWANGFYERECSICGAMKPILMHTAKVNFCPNCGADMRGDNDGKDIQSADE